MKQTLRGLAHYLGFLIVGIILIVTYKTFDNFGLIINGILQFLSILAPFFIALGIAFILHAPASWLEKKIVKWQTGTGDKTMDDEKKTSASWLDKPAADGEGKKPKKKFLLKYARGISVLAVYLVTLGAIVLSIFFATPQLVKAVTNFANSLPSYSQKAMDLINPLFEEGGLLEKVNLETNIAEMFSKYIEPYMTPDKIFSSFKNVLSFTSSILNILMAFIISIYMLLSKESLLRTVRTFFGLFFKEKNIKSIGAYGRKSTKIMYTYLFSQLIDALIVGVLMSIGCMIFGAPSPILLGLLIGLTNMIPYFGAIIGGAVVILITLLAKGGTPALMLGIWIIVMQQIDANLIQPKIIGDTVGIKPIYVLLAITVGGGLLGFWGIFFGVPLITILQMFFRDIVKLKKQKQNENEEAIMPPPPAIS